ncbi:MAG: glutamate-5-semialdehyde dehydrogenase [Lachnospiraceae bacterium]|nr:glutamate-5-semialdehyde dehydrogenase [Lachnospiraceae bacterium]
MTDFEYISKIAKEAKYCMNDLDTNKKNEVLHAVAKNLVADSKLILEANDKDMEKAVAAGMNEGRLDRLKLTEARIEAMAEGVRQVADLEDPVGRILDTHTHANGMKITKISTPFGIVGIIYENRPNVTADAWALTFKAGNVVILKGAGDALNSNMAITDCIQRTLKECNVDENAIILIKDTDRAVTTEFMKQKSFVDVLIPRGGAGLIKSVVENSLIPVIETGTGNCHIYVDEDFDLDTALNIIYNAKTQRIGVCNAAESLVVNRKASEKLLPAMEEKLSQKNVELRADDDSLSHLTNAVKATEEDFYTEYLDYIMSVKTVDNIDEAIRHINEHSTGHSECIISNNKENIERFEKEIDSACVYANVSTRFSDGFEFGLGAEIGISTQKLHARGPMGLNELTTYKYVIEGNGQVRG